MIRDLRDWISVMEELGEIVHVKGATAEEDIGTLAEEFQRKMIYPALLFEDIPGYPSGFRLLANSLSSISRLAVTQGLPPTTSERELVEVWREHFHRLPQLPPRVLEHGPLLDNTMEGRDVDLEKFPAPLWHDADGGRYIGTGCNIVLRDPESGWINVGTYRVMVHDARTAGIYISQGKHGRMICEKYWQKGEACPVAVSLGHDPLLFMVGGIELPAGMNEYAFAGALRGEPIDVIEIGKARLPVSARAEIVLEGEMPPEERRPEGPFGEWPGYYATGSRPEPVIRVSRIYYRNQPIVLGSPPAVPPCESGYFRQPLRSALIWEELEKAGVPGVEGVWCHESGGGRMLVVVAIRQHYAGHARQAGLIASQCHGGAYANRITVVVDEDINPADLEKVMWALCTRMDPKEDLEILEKCWSSPVDPLAYPREQPVYNNRVVFDACRPWHRRDDWPMVARSSPERIARVRAKWQDLLRRCGV